MGTGQGHYGLTFCCNINMNVDVFGYGVSHSQGTCTIRPSKTRCNPSSETIWPPGSQRTCFHPRLLVLVVLAGCRLLLREICSSLRTVPHPGTTRHQERFFLAPSQVPHSSVIMCVTPVQNSCSPTAARWQVFFVSSLGSLGAHRLSQLEPLIAVTSFAY